ncbi:MAG: hypothetical protein KDA90_05360 [Planctomycetaceae bacterium]|nr:hypothetical protein [Planctomycetaceae bacterium]
MPIKFRCPHCQQFLGISRAKAGNITDCPTCGRTIRIPNLDGTVDALPAPKLNLQDAGLRDALASLASLDDVAPANESADPQDRLESVPFVVPSDSRARDIVEPAIVEAAAIIEPQVEAPPINPPAAPSVARPDADPLAELATQVPAPTTATPPPRRLRRKGGGALLMGAVLIAFLAGMGIGYSIGSAPNKPIPHAEQPEVAATPPANPAKPVAPQAANGRVTIQGTLTYQTANKQTLSDSDARILIFPQQHPGQVKLPIQGFRAGADPADRRVAEASLQALGGDYTTADKGGRYVLQLPSGTYHLLLISRYSPRDENAQLIDPVRDLATAYFDRPQLLVGQVNYHYVKLTLGTQAETIDYQFSGP